MNLTHLHLMITHLPIFGSILGAAVLAYGMIVKSRQTKTAAYLLLIVSALGGIIANKTGDAAKETLKEIPGLADKTAIRVHHIAGQFAVNMMIIAGILSVASIFILWKKPRWSAAANWIMLIVALGCFILLARAGYLGGLIRHTELNPVAPIPVNSGV
jgi:uncharacterized membrane protein